MEGVKDWVLVKLESLSPELSSDTHFELRVARKSVCLEGNLADVKGFQRHGTAALWAMDCSLSRG
jgi:hypothetical protein